MVYSPATDFLALWRNSGGNVSKLEMPGLDYVVKALARAGIVNLSVSATAPVANQSTTAWLQAAVPSYSAEGTLNLWNPVTTAYAPATPGLFLDFLQACANQSGISWWTSTGGPPSNAVGNNGDFAIRLDEPNGIYGPKALGAWPLTPVPGTADVITSSALDNTFGSNPGEMLYRGTSLWQALQIGASNAIIAVSGGFPVWETLSALMDTLFGSAQGDILYRDVAAWQALAPSTAGLVLTSGGVGGNPSWQSSPSTFPSGTTMLFQQSTAPTGWTKQTLLNDCALRVVNGSTSTTAGAAMSTILAQTAVGSHTSTIGEMPSHSHVLINSANIIDGNTGSGLGGGGAFGAATNSVSIGNTGGGGGHIHSLNLAMAYTDVIIASKN